MMLQNLECLTEALKLYMVNNGYLSSCQDVDLLAACIRDTNELDSLPVIININDNGVHYRAPLEAIKTVPLPQMVNLLSGGVA